MTRILVAISLLCGLGACRPDAAPTDASTLHVDDLDRPVAVPDRVERIIPLAPNLTEIVAAAAGTDRIAAVSPVDNHPPEIEGMPRIGTYPLDMERVLAARPDLLLANSAINRVEDADRLASFDIPTFFFSFETLADVPRVIREVGRLLDTSPQAEGAAARFEQRSDAIRDRFATLDARPAVLLLIGDETLYAFGEESYTQEMIQLAGGRSITAEFRGEGVVLSEEYVLQAQPDVIIGAWGDDYDSGRLIQIHPTFRALPAVRRDRVYSIDPDLLVRPGPRLADGLERLAEIIGELGIQPSASE